MKQKINTEASPRSAGGWHCVSDLSTGRGGLHVQPDALSVVLGFTHCRPGLMIPRPNATESKTDGLIFIQLWIDLYNYVRFMTITKICLFD